MAKKKSFYLIISTLLLILPLSFYISPSVDTYFDSNKDNSLNSSYIIHEPIYIDGNSDFQVQAI